MRKTLGLLTLALSLSILCIFALTPSEKTIKVIPYSSQKLTAPPFSNTKLSNEIKAQGTHFEWGSLKDLPKKRKLFKRLLFNIQNLKTEKIIFNNLERPFSKAKLRKINKDKMILVSWEPPSVFDYQYSKEVLDLFGTVLTWHDDMVDGKKFVKIHYPVKRDLMPNLPSFQERKFLCMINANKKFNDFEKELYTLRRNLVSFCEDKPLGTLDIYGSGWGFSKNSKGWVDDKLETLKEYKFIFCVENAHVPGYVTEKLFDSFAAGAIPIYLGATNIEEYIPSNCYIDFSQFSDFEAMLSFLQKVTEEEYEAYLQNIQTFLKSPESEKFTYEAYEKVLLNVLKK
jgi:hypothetical protein